MSSPRITPTPRPDTTPEQAREASARAWAFVFACYKKNALSGTNTEGDDGTKFKEDSANAAIIPDE